MSARCEKHSGQQHATYTGADVALCHDCDVAEQLAQHTMKLDREEQAAAMIPRSQMEVENVKLAVHTRQRYAGRVFTHATAGLAFGDICQAISVDPNLSNDTFMRAAHILFLSSPHGPTTESMEEWIR